MARAGSDGHHRLRTSELRTRRLVVTDADDNDRIVGEVVGSHAELRLALGAAGAHPEAWLLVYAGTDPVLGPAIGVQLWDNGNALAEINAWHAGCGRWQWAASPNISASPNDPDRSRGSS